MPRPTFFARRAILILVIVFFFVPFALRGARMAVQGMKNDVKDWLPKEFEETKDLDEFRQYFLSEQFVLVSWDGCHGNASDERFKLFLAKLAPETPPSVEAKEAAAKKTAAEAAKTNGEANAAVDADDGEESLQNPTHYIHRDEDFIGDKLGLYFAGTWYENWGGKGEKWLKGRNLGQESSNTERWYYLLPDGDLYRWDDIDAPMAALARLITRAMGKIEIQGTLIHSFGPIDGPWYHADPRRARAQLFKTVMTGPDVLASLTREGGELDATRELDGPANQKEAERRLEGAMFGKPDPKTGQRATCMMLTLTDSARNNLHLVCGRGLLGKPRGRLYEIANESNISDTELRMGGPPIDNVAIDEEGSVTLVRLVSYSAALGIGLSLLCFRSITATIMIFFVGGISAITSVALVWWCGSSIDAIMMSMPSLVYVLGLSGAAHILNYYHDAVDEHGHAGAPERAIAHGWKPAFLCEVTTALGLITLVTSELVPIRKFGIFSAIGVMVMFCVMLTYLPAALEIWPQRPRKKKERGDELSRIDHFLSGFWQRMGGWIIDHHWFVATACTLITLGFGYGVVYMRTSVNLLKMFHSEAKIIKDYAWLEENLGHLVPMEVVVRVPKADQRPSNTDLRELQAELAADATTAARKTEIEKRLRESQFQLPFLERMEMAARVQNLVEEEFGPAGRNVVGRAISAATFVRPLPDPGSSTSTHLKRSTTSGRLQAHRDHFLHSDYLRVTKSENAANDATELWRISLRVGATKGVDYGSFVNELQETVEPVIAAQRQRVAILRLIDEQRRQKGQTEGTVAGARVLLVGLPAGVGLAKATEASQDVSGSPSDAKPLTLEDPVNQDRIFARTLLDLLTNSRLRLETASVEPGGKLPEKIADKLASYDCVVAVGDLRGLDLAAIKKAGPAIVDARNHTFVSRASQRTAWQSNPTSVAAVYTGVVPIVYKAQRLLLDSLVQSTFWSVITITPLLMWIARSVTAGSVAMLPNVLPILMVFGGMGWFGIDVDVGSMMTASIALGVAVDDTIHYLNWFREELDRVGDRKKAILAAYKHCATPTLQAAVISGLGLSVFAISTFTPTQRFGILMLVILWLGAVAELIYFPALLAGPLGSVFKPRKKATVPGHDAHGTGAAHAEPEIPRLSVVHRDEPAEEPEPAFSIVGAAEPIMPPHHGNKASALRHLRQDNNHSRS
ncbi:MAG TPA: MMPL family transporter [Pirellulaceae bacterium]|jgi:predicted RND superfamily exporter protein